MQIEFPYHATQDFRDVVLAMVPFILLNGVTIVANDDGVFVTALSVNVDLEFRIPGALAIRPGRVTVCVFALRDILKERVIRTTKTSPLTLALAGETCVALSIAKRSWQLDRQDV